MTLLNGRTTCGTAAFRGRGFAAETVGVTAARREIAIASTWGHERALDALAVHFCSDECSQNYMEQLFGEQPHESEVIEEVAVVPAESEAKRIVRTFPGAKVETTITTGKKATRVKRTKR